MPVVIQTDQTQATEVETTVDLTLVSEPVTLTAPWTILRNGMPEEPSAVAVLADVITTTQPGGGSLTNIIYDGSDPLIRTPAGGRLAAFDLPVPFP